MDILGALVRQGFGRNSYFCALERHREGICEKYNKKIKSMKEFQNIYRIHVL